MLKPNYLKWGMMIPIFLRSAFELLLRAGFIFFHHISFFPYRTVLRRRSERTARRRPRRNGGGGVLLIRGPRRRSWSRRSESIFFLKISTEDLNWLRVAWRWNTAGACWLFSKVHGVVKCEERRRKEGNKQTFLDNILSIHTIH